MVSEVTSFGDEVAKFLREEVVKFLRGGGVRFNQEVSKSQELEARVKALVGELTVAQGQTKKAEEKAKKELAVAAAAVSEANRLRGEVARLEEARAAAVASQGPVLRAFAERMVMCGTFSGLASELVAVLNRKVVSSTLKQVAAVHPEVDKSSFGYEEISQDELLASYAEVLAEVVADGVKYFPVVKSLASS